MERYYSNTLCRGLKLLYFQADPSKFAEGVQLLEKATADEEPHAFYFLARCYGGGDGNVQVNERPHGYFKRRYQKRHDRNS